MSVTKDQKYVSAVVYLCNDEARVAEFIERIDAFFRERFEHYEFIIVNDRSTDGTLAEVRRNRGRISCSNVVVLDLAWRHGLENGMLAGTEMSIGDYVFEFDSPDMDYPVEVLGEIYDRATSGYDIVGAGPKGSPRITSRIFYGILKKFSYLNLDLSTETVKVVSRRALNRVLELREKARYRKALYRYSGFPCSHVDYGTSGAGAVLRERSLTERVSLAVDVLFAFSDLGLRISLILSTVFFLISVGIGIYAIIIYLTLKTVALGWTTLSLFLSCGFSGLFLVLGILGKYLTMILTEIQGRPNYTVGSMERLKKED